MTGDGPNTAFVIDEIPFAIRGDTTGLSSKVNLGTGPDVFFTFTSVGEVGAFRPFSFLLMAVMERTSEIKRMELRVVVKAGRCTRNRHLWIRLYY